MLDILPYFCKHPTHEGDLCLTKVSRAHSHSLLADQARLRASNAELNLG